MTTAVKKQTKTVNLDALAEHKDILLLVGYLLAISGIAMFNIPAAMIVAGVCLVVLSFSMK